MRIVVFGAGYFGLNYIKELAHNVVAVVEPNSQKADYAKQHYGVRVFPELPRGLKYDGAVIVTPPDTHVQLAKLAAQKGRYVLIEKPLAVSVEEAHQLHPYRKRIMAGLVYLHHPEILRLKREVLPVVPLNHIYSRRTNDGPVRPWLNAGWDLAPHDISIFNYWFGQSPISLNHITDGRGYSLIRLQYIAAETLTYVSWRGGPKVRQIELVPETSSERIIFDDMANTVNPSPLRRMLDEFISGNWDSRCSYEAGVDVVNVLEKL